MSKKLDRDIDALVKENHKRQRTIDSEASEYDPLAGIGSHLARKPVPVDSGGIVHVPEPMERDPDVSPLIDALRRMGGADALAARLDKTPAQVVWPLIRSRFKHDFEYWCATCVTILTKKKGPQPFVLNRAQRRLLAEFERQRHSGRPIRVILLKARQWGGSTLTQIYMAWIQLFHERNWNSIIIAKEKGQAQHIRGMYKTLAKEYPEWAAPHSITFRPYEGNRNVQMVSERDCLVGVTSIERPDASRSFTFHMAHLSEVGLWTSTSEVNAESVAQAIHGGLVNAPNALCVLESTAKGVGTFFHKKWQLAEKGRIRDVPVFVPWMEFEAYALDKNNGYNATFRDALAKTIVLARGAETGDQALLPVTAPSGEEWLPDYALKLWDLGATLAQIGWYFQKRTDYQEDWRMWAEFPSTAEEAFQSSGSRAFRHAYTARARRTCHSPIAIGNVIGLSQKGRGALSSLEWVDNDHGFVKVWAHPGKSGLEVPGMRYANRYVAFADVGGTTDRADYSSVTIMDCLPMLSGGVPVRAAEFHGHLDQDLFAWAAARLSAYYDNALLAVEVNSLKTDRGDLTRGFSPDHSYTVLDEILGEYPNLFYRIRPEVDRERWDGVVGFHMNTGTKDMLIGHLAGALRDGGYTETCAEAVDEMESYEIKSDGSYGAVEGGNDDRVITTAGAVWLALSYQPSNGYTVKAIPKNRTRKKPRVGAAHFN